MRIVIDLQGAQGSNRQRGIGRYTLSLAQAIVRHRGRHEVFLALNGLFPDTVESIRAVFAGLLPQQNIRAWEMPGPVCSLNAENEGRRRSAELVREAFLASFKPDIVLVGSLFEGLSDDVVTSIGRLSRNVPTAVILYDLIPLIQRQPYLDDPKVEKWYQNKLEHLRRADLLLAISESSRQEGISYLGFEPDRAVNISTAADTQFQPKQIDSKQEAAIRQKYRLSRPFVMYTGGIDYRKNIEGLIRSYASLPEQLRTRHQLAIVCSIHPSNRVALEKSAKEQGLKSDELVLTGFVPEEDLLCFYNLCKAFVFPSWHEGFGLPALEAMSCGRAVIAANTTSVPEVVGRDDALFDPRSDEDIAAKLARVLTDDVFRAELERHGLERAKLFSWDSSARRAIASLDAWHVAQIVPATVTSTLINRPRLAYVSPLPPERSGISDYSAELLPELARYYDIDVIVSQDAVSDAWINANCPIRSVGWFKSHVREFDRVLYHFGNSHFHQHMFSLIEEVPGVVVLHDFFLSQIVYHMSVTGYQPGCWAQVLYQSHGYEALQQGLQEQNISRIAWHYPCNLGVLQRALGVVVHSEYARRLAKQWVCQDASDDWAVVPLLRVPVAEANRIGSRRILKLGSDDLLVCSFGLMGQAKLSHRLLDTWLASSLTMLPHSKLIFVGELLDDDYGKQLLAKIKKSGLVKQVQITGWLEVSSFRHYLAAADIAVQLRTLSRGETSAALLDCMNYGLPTIVNANGSMADVPDDGVWKLPDEFTDAELISALETLSANAKRRVQIGKRAREIVLSEHQPNLCANRYMQAIESIYKKAETGLTGLTRAIGKISPLPAQDEVAWMELAQSIARSLPMQLTPRQLLVDISELVQRDVKSGIQRVVRSLLKELLINPPIGYRVEPVYATFEQGYQYARQFTLRFLNCDEDYLRDDPVDFQAGDIFFGLDLNPHVVQSQQKFYQQMRNAGVQVKFAVYDLLPITLPWAFGESASATHAQWLNILAENDGVVCISKSVADEVREWLTENCPSRLSTFDIQWFHLGADIGSSLPTSGLPETAPSTLAALAKRPTFLMVGTLEPRKGYLQTLAAFEQLWATNTDVNLVIVGKQGWMVDKLVEKLCNHSELNSRLHWLENISDEFLEKVYAVSTCLIAASEGEGFGLPLIEAAQHQLPIIARDIPVFREVAGDHAYYFVGTKPEQLAVATRNWIALDEKNNVPDVKNMPWLTWSESSAQLVQRAILGLNHVT